MKDYLNEAFWLLKIALICLLLLLVALLLK